MVYWSTEDMEKWLSYSFWQQGHLIAATFDKNLEKIYTKTQKNLLAAPNYFDFETVFKINELKTLDRKY